MWQGQPMIKTTAEKIDNPIELIFFGTPQFSAQILERLAQFTMANPEFLIKAVVTTPDKVAGRRQLLTPSATALAAQKHELPVLKPDRLDRETVAIYRPLLAADLYIVAAYGKILPQDVLDIPKLGAINIHGSILPKYRGASPIQQAILRGDKKTGVTFIMMDDQVDHGRILHRAYLDLSDDDTYESLSSKMSQLSADHLVEFLPKFIRGEITSQPQNHAKASFCPLIKREDGYFNLNKPPATGQLERMIRAYFPWPNAWTVWKTRGKQLRVKFLPRGFIQLEGRQPVKFQDFLNGHPDFPLKTIGLFIDET